MCNISITGRSKEEEREKGIVETFETIMTDSFPKIMSDTKPAIQEAQRIPRKIKAKENHT